MSRRNLFLIAAIACFAALFALGAVAFRSVIQGWFIASLFWVQLPLGALMMRLIVRLTGGGRQAGAIAALDPALSLTPWAWLLVLPMVIGAQMLFPRNAGALAGPIALLTGSAIV